MSNKEKEKYTIDERDWLILLQAGAREDFILKNICLNCG